MRAKMLASAMLLLSAQMAFAASPEHPAVVELFTSQGCSSCPPANANIVALADRGDVIALTFNVTYWDYLGWKDTFARPEFTRRQVDYERPLGNSAPFTPQVVIDGRFSTVGAVRSDIERLIAQSRRDGEPSIAAQGDRLTVAAGEGAGTVWLVRYDPRLQNVPIHAGENDGVTLPHKNVVRSLTALGTWDGHAASFALPPAPPGLASAILVQDGKGGPILAARRI